MAAANYQTAHLRQVVSRFGGMIAESNAVHIPPQAPTQMGVAATGYDTRHKPATANVYAGIPGYAGYRPHGSHPRVMGEQSAPKAHSRPLYALDVSKQPYIMPVVGYKGHIRMSQEALGTSHWKNSGAVTNNKAAASLPWDNRDVAGRPYGGWAPMDGGRYVEDPEMELKRREAEEANEILELRSMGIRALLKAQPELGGSR